MADLVLILVLGLFVFVGYKRGFAKTLVGMVSNLVSVIFGILLVKPVAYLIYISPLGKLFSSMAENFLQGKTGGIPEAGVAAATDAIAMIIASVVSFVLVTIIVKILAIVLANAVNIVAKLPLIRRANAVLGAVVGAVSGFVCIYVAIGVIAVLYEGGAIGDGTIISSVQNSLLCGFIYNNNILLNTVSSIL